MIQPFFPCTITVGRSDEALNLLVRWCFGTGGVSVFALQLAEQMGARVIVTSSSSNEKLERARGLGADFGVNYHRNENWCEAVLELTKGRGVDLVVVTRSYLCHVLKR